MKPNNRTYISCFHLALIILLMFSVAFADSNDLGRLEEKEKIDKALSAVTGIERKVKLLTRIGKKMVFPMNGMNPVKRNSSNTIQTE
jgi:hypothetical protein